MSDERNVPPVFDGRDVHHVKYHPGGRSDFSTAVVEAVAAVEGVDPTRTRVPIGQSVDPDALDELFNQSHEDRAEAYLVFPVWEYTVVVRGDGHVFVHEEDAGCRTDPG